MPTFPSDFYACFWAISVMIKYLLPPVAVRPNTISDPPSLIFNFLANSGAESGKLRTATLSLGYCAENPFTAAFENGMMFFMAKISPGKSGIYVAEKNRFVLG